jgi:hypothetical protein
LTRETFDDTPKLRNIIDGMIDIYVDLILTEAAKKPVVSVKAKVVWPTDPKECFSLIFIALTLIGMETSMFY